jgi:hypothetical protein
MTPLLKTLAASGALLSLALGALWVSRNYGPDARPAEPWTTSPRESKPPALGRTTSPTHVGASARSLIPKNAWLIVDFDTNLSERAPFEDSRDPQCRAVTSPPRAAFGVLPPKDIDAEPAMVLAAPEVSPAFFACARSRILESGGVEAPLAPGIDLLKSRNGILIHEQATGSLVFATGSPNLELLIKTLFGLPTGLPSASEADHAENQGPTVAYLTLALPEDWLGRAGEDARISPLRHARGGTASLLHGGSLTATLSCDPAGCDELRKFAERALGDLSKAEGWEVTGANWSEQPGKIALRLNMRTALSRAIGGLLFPPLSRQ